MAPQSCITEGALDALRRLDACAVEDAIETFDLRARNTGFANSSIRCLFEDLPPIVGYAATARLRSGDRPMSGHRYQDRSEWWTSILEVPEPRIVVLQDIDTPPGVGAFLGDTHAAMLQALGCIGYVTNGGIREVTAIRETRFQVFAGNVAVSHAYARIIESGCPVEVAGMHVVPGDLLHGDRHGLVNIPKKIAPEIPHVVTRLMERDRRLMAVCRSPEFSVEKLRDAINELG